LGHPVGDKTLKTIAEILLDAVRSIDIVARCGGDEFMVILPETGEALAVEIAERVRKKMETTLALSEARSCMITASIGVVSYPKHGESLEQLLENVDKALYRAKNRGKNRIEVFS
jgi:diguanylate cyclase (GGDEF)-like protein